MEQYRQLTGTISIQHSITGRLHTVEALTGTANIPNLTPPIFPTYDGEYTVTPHFFEQTLETNNKLMTDDVTVEIIPAYEVPNIAGGLTVTIG